MKVKRLIGEWEMDKLKRLCGSKLVTGDRDKDLSKRDFSQFFRIFIFSILILLLFALTIQSGSSAPDPRYSFEGWDTKQGKWQPANICCYLEGDCVPCRVIVDNTKPHAIAETLTEQIFFDYNSEPDYSGTLGVVDLENFVLPGGATSGPFYNVITNGVEIYYWWNYTIPAGQSWTMTFCARLSDECGHYPGASMHGRLEQGNKDISIKKPTDMPDLYVTKTATVTCDAISYTINYGNSGDADQTNTMLVDDYDETKVTVTDAGGGIDNGDTITWSIGTVAVSGTGSVSYTVSIKEGVANGAVIINSGTISGDLAEKNTDDNHYSVTSYAKVSPTATAGSNSPVCEGDTIELYGGPDGMASYSWTGPGSWTSDEQNPTRLDATLAMAGEYTLTATDANGCTDSDDVTVTVVEFCEASAPDFSICQGTTVNDQLFLDQGASCTAGCTVSLSYSFDGSTVGAYTYTVTCLGDCGGDTDTGTVTVVEFCEASAPDFSICQGTTVNDQLFLDQGASCTAGCTVSLSYSFDGSTVGAYTYTVTCLGDCGGDTDTGTVTVVEFCEASAPDFSICQGTTVNDQLFLDQGASCTAGCTVSLSYSFDGSTVGAYTYTVTCLGDCGGDTDEGTVTVVEFCEASAPDFSICQGTTVNDQLFLDQGASCTAGCTVSLSYSFDGSTVGAYTYTVTCLGDCGGDTDEGTVTVVEFCEASAPDFSICQGTTVNDQLFLDQGASCTAGCTVSLSYSFDGSTVGAYTYTVTCLGDCGGDTDTGTVTVVEFCEASAPDFSICQGTTVNDQLFLDQGASCTAGCTVSLSYSFDGSTVGAYTYTVTCLGDCGGDTDEGTVTVVEFCEASAPDFSICQGTTVNDQLFLDQGASCTAGCTVSLSYSFDGAQWARIPTQLPVWAIVVVILTKAQ